MAAGLYGVFLGGLGIHWFYLNHPLRGLLYLLFSWTLIPAILGLIEGITFLSWSDRRFDRRFNR
jgi:TM2 domain-containing membrane protein YozV